MRLPAGARQRGPEILARLRPSYGPPYVFLDFRTPFQLLIAVILSAQCTDEMVNRVTPDLWAHYPRPVDLARAPRDEVERLVFRTGFYRSKAKNIQGAAAAVAERFGGEVPVSMAELLTIPGVARKTANVMQAFFGTSEGVCVDTHVGRVARRLGLTAGDTPVKVERDLMKVYPQADWADVPFYLILHGRQVCDARKPACHGCQLADLCPKRGVAASTMVARVKDASWRHV